VTEQAAPRDVHGRACWWRFYQWHRGLGHPRTTIHTASFQLCSYFLTSQFPLTDGPFSPLRGTHPNLDSSMTGGTLTSHGKLEVGRTAVWGRIPTKVRIEIAVLPELRHSTDTLGACQTLRLFRVEPCLKMRRTVSCAAGGERGGLIRGTVLRTP